MWKVLLDTRDDYTALLLRVVLGAIILPHGAQKLLGWFGGYGFEGTMSYFTQTLGIPVALGVLVILAESFGGLALLIGLGSRVIAAGIGAIMVGAVALVHYPYGFFMNWSGTQGGEGFEFHLLMLGVSIAVTLQGSGAWSVDRWLAQAAVVSRHFVTRNRLQPTKAGVSGREEGSVS